MVTTFPLAMHYIPERIVCTLRCAEVMSECAMPVDISLVVAAVSLASHAFAATDPAGRLGDIQRFIVVSECTFPADDLVFIPTVIASANYSSPTPRPACCLCYFPQIVTQCWYHFVYEQLTAFIASSSEIAVFRASSVFLS